jgi:hypothetical protein
MSNAKNTWTQNSLLYFNTRSTCTVLQNKAVAKIHTQTHTHIYIYIYILTFKYNSLICTVSPVPTSTPIWLERLECGSAESNMLHMTHLYFSVSLLCPNLNVPQVKNNWLSWAASYPLESNKSLGSGRISQCALAPESQLWVKSR